MTKMLVSIRDLTLRLPSGDRTLTVLDGVSLDVAAGETVAVAGPSGSGKSTLLGLIGGLDAPTSGTIVVAGMEVTRLGEAALAPFLLDGVAGDARLNQADGIHPTAEGQRVIAERLWPHLKALLTK